MMQAAVEANTSTPEAIADSFARLACDQLRSVCNFLQHMASFGNSFARFACHQLSSVRIFLYTIFQAIAHLRSAQFCQNTSSTIGCHTTGLARSRWILSGPMLSWSTWAPLAPILEAGFALGSLFTEAAWHLAAITVYKTCRGLVQKLHPLEPCYTNYKLETLSRLLHSLAAFCMFKDANPVAHQLEECLKSNQALSPFTFPNLAAVYNELSSFRFTKSEYQESYDWAMLALQALVPASPLKLVIDVTRQASKACTVKREFRKAEMLVKHSLLLTKATFGAEHVKYADCLVNYGFYLLNVDRISTSVDVYRTARDIRLNCFGKKNLQVFLF